MKILQWIYRLSRHIGIVYTEAKSVDVESTHTQHDMIEPQSQFLKIEHIHFIERFTTLYCSIIEKAAGRKSTITKEHIRIEWHARIWERNHEKEMKWNWKTHVCGVNICEPYSEKPSIEKCDANVAMLFIILLSTFLCIFHVSLNIVTACLPACLLCNPWSFKAHNKVIHF